MTDAEIYLRAAERIDSGECSTFGATLPQNMAIDLMYWRLYGDGNEWTRETRVLILCFMAAMEEAT